MRPTSPNAFLRAWALRRTRRGLSAQYGARIRPASGPSEVWFRSRPRRICASAQILYFSHTNSTKLKNFREREHLQGANGPNRCRRVCEEMDRRPPGRAWTTPGATLGAAAICRGGWVFESTGLLTVWRANASPGCRCHRLVGGIFGGGGTLLNVGGTRSTGPVGLAIPCLRHVQDSAYAYVALSRVVSASCRAVGPAGSRRRLTSAGRGPPVNSGPRPVALGGHGRPFRGSRRG
jgi:hypothetical protein